MDESTVTNVEPQVIETDNAAVAEQPAVVEQATPMDSNTTYQNVPQQELAIDPNKDFTQNVVQDTIQIANQQAVTANAGQAMNRFLTQEYSYNPEEAGTYWVAGGINDKETQMMFLNTIINEEMYDEMDLQKYYYDTTMATARAYAAQKEKETAYGYYRAAQEKAIAEAQLTGWYMPAEGQYMLMNYEAAQVKLEDPDATPEEIAKAQRISGTTEQWFAANKIGPKGMKCLSMMNYEENVRHNTIMGELQKEANKIAAAGAAASSAAADLQLRLQKFQLEEYELQTGHNITKEIGLDNKDVIGHDLADYDNKYQALKGYKGNTTGEAISQMLMHDPDSYAAVLMSSDKKWIDGILKSNGHDPEEFYTRYEAKLGDNILKENKEANGNILDESRLNKTGQRIANGEGKNKEIYSFTSTGENGEPETRLYYKDNNGVFKQITDENTKIIIKDYVENVGDKYYGFTTNDLTYDGEAINVGNKMDASRMPGSYTYNIDAYKSLTDKQKSAIEGKEQDGWHVVDGAYSTKKKNTLIVMQDKDGKYYEVENDGKVQELTDKEHLKFETIDAEEGTTLFWVDKNGSISGRGDAPRLQGVTEKDANGKTYGNGRVVHDDYVFQKSMNIGDNIYVYINPDGSEVYLEKAKINGGGQEAWSITVISQKTAEEKTGKNLSSIGTNASNYQAGYIETKTGLNSKEIEAKNKQENKTDLDLGNVGGSAGGDTTRDATYDAQTTDVKEATYNKYELTNDPNKLLEAISDEEKNKQYKTGDQTTINKVPVKRNV